MKKQLLVLMLCFGLSYTFAQQNVLSSGKDSASPYGKSTYSVGLIHYKEASGSGGSSSAGAQISYEVLEVLSVPESELIAVKVFPNPVKRVLTINFNSQNQYQYQIVDLAGRKVAEGSISKQNNTIQLQHLNASMYILNLRDQNNSLIKSYKISKQ